MSKTILYRWFGLGKIPERERIALEFEGIVLAEEGVGCTVTMKNFRAPGRRHSHRKSWFSGSLVLTQQRFAGFSTFRDVVNVPLNAPHFRLLDISVDRGDVLCVAFEAGDFNETHSGSVICRWRTPLARSFEEHLRAFL